jgi:hypothetical protein
VGLCPFLVAGMVGPPDTGSDGRIHQHR